MTFLTILLLITVAMSVETIRLILRDGRGPQHPPTSHYEDDRFQAPAARG